MPVFSTVLGFVIFNCTEISEQEPLFVEQIDMKHVPTESSCTFEIQFCSIVFLLSYNQISCVLQCIQ